MPKKMNRLGAGPLSRVRGFFYPVEERPEIQTELEQRAAIEQRAADEHAALEQRSGRRS